MLWYGEAREGHFSLKFKFLREVVLCTSINGKHIVHLVLFGRRDYYIDFFGSSTDILYTSIQVDKSAVLRRN